MHTTLTKSDLKPISIVLYSIIVTCFSSYAVAETMLVKNFAVFFLFVAVTCLSVCFFFCQKSVQSPDRSSDISAVKYFDNDIKKALTLFNSGVKNNLDLIRNDLNQIRFLIRDASSGLTESFYCISSRIDQQQRLMERLIENCNDNSVKRKADQIKLINQFIKEDTGNCIRSLQFEDIVSQVADHSALYLEDVDKYLNNLQLKFDALEHGKSLGATRELHDSLTTITGNNQKDSITTDRTNIVQRSLSAGNIEMF